MRRKPIFNPPVVGAFLTTREVAAFEGVTTLEVSAWCRANRIYPAQNIGGRWRIAPGYIVTGQPKHTGPGRPKGAKNKRPYPFGVKRPRKPKQEGGEPPTQL